MPRFFASDLVAEEAGAVYEEHERRIREQLPHVEVRHTGGTSIAGALTLGDVDIHVRVDRESFPTAREILSGLYEPMYLDAWHQDGAFFADPTAQPPVEVALTVIGTLDDVHHGAAWRQLASDPALLERYNALKREHEHSSVDDYNAAKRAFFRDNFRLERPSATGARETGAGGEPSRAGAG
jgi:GrpB-like predicted nucleotidyltransferase (UPF0157 family)